MTRIIQLVKKLEDPEIIISGSLPPGVHPEVYSKIIEVANSRGSKIIPDTDGAALQSGVRMFPDVIKPDVHELSRLAGLELKDIHEIISTAQTICNQGTGVVLVSSGDRGILLLGKKNDIWLSCLRQRRLTLSAQENPQSPDFFSEPPPEKHSRNPWSVRSLQALPLHSDRVRLYARKTISLS